MLAYPGPQSVLRDELAVEAFVDSLDDSELEISVKDRFPKDLVDAFQIALRLEANRPAGMKNKEAGRVGRANPEAGGKFKGRNDVEARQVDWQEGNQLQERLSRLEQALKDSKIEARRKQERERSGMCV